MKRLIFMGVALALVLGLVWVPAVAALSADITIHKTVGLDCPAETFHFEAWRDMNGNGVIDEGDTFQGEVDITGAGTGVITVSIFGLYVITEELESGSVYEPHPDQTTFISCDADVYFDNTCEPPQVCELVILKTDTAGGPLGGACFTFTPDPWTGTDSVTVCDNDSNDNCSDDGILCLTDLICELTVTVEETTVPDGYVGADPQEAIIGETLELTFVNERLVPDICIEKLVDCNDDGVYLTEDIGYYGDIPSWYIRVWNCGETPLLNVMVSDTNGRSWGPFDLDVGVEWFVTYDGDPIFETTTNTAEAIAEDGLGDQVGPVYASATNFIRLPDCGTVCAAQTAPGEFLFGPRQDNWFTWIYYDIGSGTEASPYEYPIYVGQTTLCGTLYVYDDGTHIFVNYALTDTATCALAGLSQYHLQVDETFDDLCDAVVKGKNPVPGKCEYKGGFDPMVSETGYIECADDDVSGWTRAYIFAHGVGCFICP
jgi:hypothetical protein